MTGRLAALATVITLVACSGLVVCCGGGSGGAPTLGAGEDADTNGDALAGEDAAIVPAEDAAPSCSTDIAAAEGLILTDRGAVRGAVSEGVAAFLGIPYAAPPVGPLRWARPADTGCWDGVIEATDFAPPCIQTAYRMDLPDAEGEVLGQEDCLYLDVWAPSAPSAPRPVMVFVHGGGNVQGDAASVVLGEPLTDGRLLAERGDVVVVTFQYRLGPLGFLAIPGLDPSDSETPTSNLGLLDQLAALQWVQRNIASFGGDPDRVTLFGESAGGFDVCALMSSPLSEGLIAQALIESGGCAAAPREMREAQGIRFAASVGCAADRDDPTRLASCLRALPAETLVAGAPHPFPDGLIGGGGFGPTIDGVVLPQDPMTRLAQGDVTPIPLLIGTNEDETAVGVAEGAITPERVEEYLRAFGETNADALLALYPPGDTPEEARDAWIRATSDAQFICPARRIARAAEAHGAPVWRYQFTHEAASALGGGNGAFHGLDLLYVFQGVGRILGGVFSRPEDEAVEALMARCWSRFAATGDPNTGGGDDDTPAWPPYDAERDPYLEIAPTPSVGAGIHSAACDAWDAVPATAPMR